MRQPHAVSYPACDFHVCCHHGRVLKLRLFTRKHRSEHGDLVEVLRRAFAQRKTLLDHHPPKPHYVGSLPLRQSRLPSRSDDTTFALTCGACIIAACSFLCAGLPLHQALVSCCMPARAYSSGPRTNFSKACTKDNPLHQHALFQRPNYLCATPAQSYLSGTSEPPACGLASYLQPANSLYATCAMSNHQYQNINMLTLTHMLPTRYLSCASLQCTDAAAGENVATLWLQWTKILGQLSKAVCDVE